ncbi:hypothetical protein J5X84_01165 [Streptosporangiaceae bacterium NEAU-GS5]|nr:hypothetical protein [Streptosporangiaceae bacterium NEAU-GS5]
MFRTLAALALACALAATSGCSASTAGPAQWVSDEAAASPGGPGAEGSAGPAGSVGAKPAPVRHVRIPAGVTAGYVVFDRVASRVTVGGAVHHRFRSASVVKLLIAIDYLESLKPGQRPSALLTPMLRASDDSAATAFWRRGGQARILQRMIKEIRLTDTGPPPAGKPGFWGYTAISALDIARVYRYLLDRAKPGVRNTILGHLRKAAHCGSDGFDQYFGLPSASPRPWAIKQGWSGYGSTPPFRCGTITTSRSATVPTAAGNPVDFVRPVLHTTGVTGTDLIIVILTSQPAGSSFASGYKRLTAIARAVYRAAHQE